MPEVSNSEQVIEKSLKDQIIDKMIDKLKASENFSRDLLTELEKIDLSSKSEVREVISRV